MRRLALLASFLPLACGSSKEPPPQDPPVREVALDCSNVVNASGAVRPPDDARTVWLQRDTIGVVSEDDGATYRPFVTGLTGSLAGSAVDPVALVGPLAYVFRGGATQPRVSEDGGRTWTDAAFTPATYPAVPRSVSSEERAGLLIVRNDVDRLIVSRDGGVTFEATDAWLKGRRGAVRGRHIVERSQSYGDRISHDGGATFTNITAIEDQREAIQLTDDGRMVMRAYSSRFPELDNEPTRGYVLAASSDDGASWQLIGPMNVGVFTPGIEPNEIWAEWYPKSTFSDLPVFIHTTDFGVTWERVRFSSAGEPLDPVGNGTELTRLADGRIQVVIPITATTTLRDNPLCTIATSVSGTNVPRLSPRRSDAPGSIALWAQVPRGTQATAPLPTLGQAVSLVSYGLAREVGSDPTIGMQVSITWSNVTDVVLGSSGAIWGMFKPAGWSYTPHSPRYALMPIDPATLHYDEAEPRHLANIGNVTMASQQFPWEARETIAMADGEFLVRALGCPLDAPCREAVVTRDGAANRTGYNLYPRMSADRVLLVPSIWASPENHALPVIPLASYSGGAQDYCAIGACMEIPGGRTAEQVWISNGGIVWALAEHTLYGRRYADGSGVMTVIADGFLRPISLRSAPDAPDDTLFVLDGEDLFRLVPSFTQVASRPFSD